MAESKAIHVYPSHRAMALGSTQTLAEMINKSIPWG